MTAKPTTDAGRAVLARCDKGEYPDDIAEAEGVTLGYVYQILREHRPKRARKPREKTSTARAAILFYAMVEKLPPHEIVAKMAGKCSRQLIYRILSESGRQHAPAA